MSYYEKPSSNKLENFWNIYNVVNDWIRFSDTKATALLAINGVITGFYFSNMTELSDILAKKPITIFPLLMVGIFVFLSTFFSMSCIVPRLKIDRKDSLIFFSDIEKNYSNSEAYKKALESLTEDNFKNYPLHTPINSTATKTHEVPSPKFS